MIEILKNAAWYQENTWKNMREVSFRDHQNYMYYTNIMANAWGVSQYLVHISVQKTLSIIL